MKSEPQAKAEMLIRKPVGQVFEAFVDPVMLAGAKALLEHGVRLNLVADRFPAGVEEPST
jgi:hypothetical protein